LTKYAAARTKSTCWLDSTHNTTNPRNRTERERERDGWRLLWFLYGWPQALLTL